MNDMAWIGRLRAGLNAPVDTPVGTGRIATVAACMAKGCTPEQTDRVMHELASVKPPWDASAIQRQLEEVIDRIQGADLAEDEGDEDE